MARTLKERRNAKIEERCIALAKVLRVLRPIYTKASLGQKQFIETMIGAAIWYIPAPQNAWTGYISVEVIKSFLGQGARSPISEEHVIPRKLAAKRLLAGKMSGTALVKIFCEKYCKVHYVTPRENKLLTQLQRDSEFTASSKTYGKVGIKLIKVTKKQLVQIKRKDLHTIAGLLEARAH